MTATPIQTAMMQIVMVTRHVLSAVMLIAIPARTSVTVPPIAERLLRRRPVIVLTVSIMTAMQIPTVMTRTAQATLHVIAEKKASLVLLMQIAAKHVIQERVHVNNGVFQYATLISI